MKRAPIQFFNRYSGEIETEVIYGEGFLRWAYENPLGRITVEGIAKRLFFSAWYGWRMSRPGSRSRIRPFVDTFGLNPAEFRKSIDEFSHFNDFFARELNSECRPLNNDENSIVFPADGRHFGFPRLDKVDSVFVKGQQFDLATLLINPELTARYRRGTAVLSRLCPTDYHRFHFPCQGTPGFPLPIKGYLYSVSPVALRRQLAYLWQNKRMITKLETPHLGTVTIVEFGATNVGSINQTFPPNRPVDKGQEKGFFLFGGSATMTFFEPNKVQLAPDLIHHSAAGRELYAHMGDAMGTGQTKLSDH